MEIGIRVVITDETINVVELAKEVEARGFASLWAPEHTHMPINRATPYPPGGDLPRDYCRIADPFVTLAAAAAVTERIKIGTSVCLAFQHDPLRLAKSVATLDRLANGRFQFGVGAGWSVEEMLNHGVDPATRGARLEETIHALKRLWTEDEASFAGRFINFDPVWSYPKPVSNPHPPVLIGGYTQRAIDRAIQVGDGWLPPVERMTDIVGEIEAAQRRAIELGHDRLRVIAYGVPHDAAVLAQLAEVDGVTDAVFRLPYGATREVVLPLLDEISELTKSLQMSN